MFANLSAISFCSSNVFHAKYDDINSRANYYMFFITFIACSIMIVSKEVIFIVGPSSYLEGVNLFVPIIVGMFFLFLYTIPVVVEYYYKETRFIGLTTFIAAVINVVTNYFFIRLYGYQAAAYTTLFTYVIMFGFHWNVSKWLLKKRGIDPFLKLRPFLIYIFVVVCVAVFVLFLNPYPLIKYSISFIVTGIFLYFTKNQWKPLVVNFWKERIKK